MMTWLLKASLGWSISSSKLRVSRSAPINCPARHPPPLCPYRAWRPRLLSPPRCSATRHHRRQSCHRPPWLMSHRKLLTLGLLRLHPCRSRPQCSHALLVQLHPSALRARVGLQSAPLPPRRLHRPHPLCQRTLPPKACLAAPVAPAMDRLLGLHGTTGNIRTSSPRPSSTCPAPSTSSPRWSTSLSGTVMSLALRWSKGHDGMVDANALVLTLGLWSGRLEVSELKAHNIARILLYDIIRMLLTAGCGGRRCGCSSGCNIFDKILETMIEKGGEEWERGWPLSVPCQHYILLYTGYGSTVTS